MFKNAKTFMGKPLEIINYQGHELLNIEAGAIKDLNELIGFEPKVYGALSLPAPHYSIVIKNYSTRVLMINNQSLESVPEPISKLTKLERLYLISNKISHIKGLEKLKELAQLSLNNNQISKIEGLDGLAKLEYLGLNNNQISKIEGLENLTGLKELWLDNNLIYLLDQDPAIKGLEARGVTVHV